MDEKMMIWKPELNKEHRHWRGLDLKRFAHQNKEIVIRFCVLVLTFCLACGITSACTASKLKKEFEKTLAAACLRTEQETVDRMRAEYGVTAAEEAEIQMQEEAKLIAKVLYPMAGNSDKGLRSACLCVICRLDSKYYSDDLLGVLSQNQAFMGWSMDNPVVDRLYNIALHEVRMYHSGIRPTAYSMVFLRWSPSEIVLFDSFDGNAHYWYEDDWDEYDAAHAA